ncbi:MAG: glutamate synthase subunit beta [Treponema sp.]|nr:glutamate synthase subunit beta [Treponema sp.]
MGKATGFLDCQRQENKNVPPLERIQNFKEFHPALDEKARREQASRCMNCGVPMCSSAIKLSGMVTGCPLHNFIPEWNEALYQGQFDMAAWRLLKTSSFPEFTGRVCPALCEKACNCASPTVGQGAVTVHDNELFIIEKAFETGYMKPQIPERRSGKKIAVIGAGPAGLAAADALNRRGHNVTVFEREDKAGGLLMYGIPNMKLDKKIIERRVKLMKDEGVEFIFNADVGNGSDAKKILQEYDAVALCCGAKKARPLSAEGTEKISSGIYYAVDFLKSVTKTLLKNQEADNKTLAKKLSEDFKIQVEGKDVIVLGGGDTGNDCTGSVIRLGCKSVTQLEMMPCPPTERSPNNPWPEWPKTLKTDYGAQESIEKFGRDPRVYKTTIKKVHSEKGRLTGITTVQVEFKMVDGQRKLCEIEGSQKELKADLLLIAAGFLGCEDYTAKAFGVPLNARSAVETCGQATPSLASPNGYKTSVSKIFSAGDMRRGQSLVVWAIAEGRECARQIDESLMGYSNM